MTTGQCDTCISFARKIHWCVEHDRRTIASMTCSTHNNTYPDGTKREAGGQ